MEEQVKILFGDISLYEILGVAKDCSEADLKKAYYKKSLVYHPDKSNEDGAKEKFVVLGEIYKLLSDPKKREHYDKYGEMSDEESAEFTQWAEYWRHLFPAVTVDGIENFMEEFKGEDEEREHVIDAYKRFKGNMNKVIENVMLSEVDDIGRFVHDYIHPLIEKGELKRYKALEKFEGYPVKKLEKGKKRGKAGGTVVVASKKQIRESSFNSLIEKIQKKNGMKQEEPDIDEEEFLKIRKGLEKKRKN